jgi:HlyD family secretion protein
MLNRLPQMPRLSRMRIVLVVAAIVVVAVLVVVLKLRGKEVEVWVARSGPLVQTVVVSGRMASESRVFLGATITGRVRDVRYREGALVEAGRVIVQLEDGEQVAAVQQAAAALRSAEARLDSQRRLSGPVAQQQFEQARSNATAAERERERAESLFLKGFIGQSRLDEARRAGDVAKSQMRNAETQATANLQGSEMEQALARVAEARAALDFARSKQTQTRIIAPADGLLLERLAEPGQIVQPGARLIEMSIKGPVQLIAQVDEKFLSQLAVGEQAQVMADAFPGQPFIAKVQSIAPSIDVQRGSIEVKFAIDTPPAFLRNDMTLSLEIETARRANVLALPAECVRAGPAVWVIDDGRAVRRAVKTGVRTLTAVEIVDGLKDGEAVILDAVIAEGARVRGIPRRPAPASAISDVAAEGMKSFTRE